VHTACFTTAAGLQPSPVTPRLVWQYWNGSGWQKLAVRDGSEGFTRSGLVEFLAPSDFAVHELFGRKRYWLRALWQEGDYSVSPRLRQLVLNTTLAVQSQTFLNEILGSSTGSEDQVFRSTRSPVLEGQRLEVREPELPGAGEQALLKKEEGDDAISVVTDAAGRPREIWVRWHEVPDFYGSGPRDRHYVMDHLTGEIRFGDGISGRIPPIGAGNLRLARYQSGGGAIANRAAGTVTQLKTTVPYIEKVTNPEAAAGGAEAEPIEALYERMPRTLRHRDRAVTLEDYEDLAALASSEVARTLCVPLRDLAADPLGDSPRYGMVSVIVVPRTSDAKPQPTLELLSRVQSFLEERAPADAGLAVVGPLYVRVDVHVELAVGSISEASTVERAVRERLDGFLHPLTGGLDAKGWDFGRAPHRSDFLALVEGIPGVDHVRFLKIDETEDLEAVRRTGRFLVYSGQHQINLVFDEA
jgi:predicted phage baseplate assembly protein